MRSKCHEELEKLFDLCLSSCSSLLLIATIKIIYLEFFKTEAWEYYNLGDTDKVKNDSL